MLYFYFTERKHTRENYYIYRKVMPFVVFTRIASDVGVGANCNPGLIPLSGMALLEPLHGD